MRSIVCFLLAIVVASSCYGLTKPYTVSMIQDTDTKNRQLKWEIDQLNDDIYKNLSVGDITEGKDLAGFDFLVGNFITDGNWHMLSLSNRVAAGARIVFMNVTITNAAASKYIQFRKYGNVNSLNSSYLSTQVANIDNNADIMVFCNAYRQVEYRTTNGAFSQISVQIKGWSK